MQAEGNYTCKMDINKYLFSVTTAKELDDLERRETGTRRNVDV